MKQIIRLLDFLGKKFRSITQKVEKRHIEERGESKMSPRELRKITFISFFTIGILIAGSYLISEIDVGDGLENFKKNKAPKFDITQSKEIEQLDGMDFLNNISPGIDGDGRPGFPGKESLSDFEQKNLCLDLKNKVDRGVKLSASEFSEFKKCLDERLIEGLSSDQVKAYEMLSNPDAEITDAERKLLENIANNTATPEEKKLFDALTSNDPLARQVAKELINNPNLTEEERRALENFLETGEGRNLVDSLLNGTNEEKALAREIINNPNSENLENLKEKLNDIRAQRRGDKRSIEESLGETQNQIESDEKLLNDPVFKKQIEEIETKLKNNIPLTKEEQAIYDFYKEVVERNRENKKKKERLLSVLREINEKRIASGMDSYESLNSDAEGGSTRVIIKKTPPKRISPSEYELIQKIKMARMGDDYEGSLLPNVTPSGDQKTDAKTLSSPAPNILKAYNLPPDIKIPCVSETELLVPKGQDSGQKFICKIEDNIYDPENNNNVLVSKGSTAICKTSGFSSDTKLMSVTCDKVRNGAQLLDIPFSITNSSGREGVMGGIISTRGMKVTAAVLADSANGITQYLAEVAKLQQAQITNGVPNLTRNITGSIAQGVSSGFSKMAEILVQDLEGTPDVYYTPRGHKLFLMPN